MKLKIPTLFLFSLFLFIFISSNVFANSEQNKIDIETITDSRSKSLKNEFNAIIKKHKVNTAGVAIIKKGEVVWDEVFGNQSEGIPANKQTLFDVASLTKTITAETILRLVAQGKLSLDESIAPYWIDPDLKEDPNVGMMTPRMLLNHTSGFLNWRYFSDDMKLRFVNEPGSAFGYSGEGFEYLARYAENKLGIPFEKLVESVIFEPLKLENASFVVNKEMFERIAKPLDANGKFQGYYCHPQGYCSKEGNYSAAANLVISVSDYARFLVSSMNGEGLNSRIQLDRNTMQGVQFTKKDLDCGDKAAVNCPTRLGYGLGWSMSEFKNGKIIGHRGTNWTVISLTYYYPESKDGLVVFFNAPNKSGLAAMVDTLNILDPDSPEIYGYKLRLARNN